MDVITDRQAAQPHGEDLNQEKSLKSKNQFMS